MCLSPGYLVVPDDKSPSTTPASTTEPVRLESLKKTMMAPPQDDEESSKIAAAGAVPRYSFSRSNSVARSIADESASLIPLQRMVARVLPRRASAKDLLRSASRASDSSDDSEDTNGDQTLEILVVEDDVVQ